MVTVVISYKSSGKPVCKAKVELHLQGWSTGYTDDRGRVDFDVSSGQASLWVHGTKWDGYISGETCVYI
jgi:hypothetical protein